MIGSRYECQCCGRKLTITDEYADDDSSGYYYLFDNEPGTRWIETYAASIRFKKLGKLKEK